MFTPTFFDDMDAIIINDYYRTNQQAIVHNWGTAVYDSPGHAVSVIPAPSGSSVRITAAPAQFLSEHVLLVPTVTISSGGAPHRFCVHSVRLSSPSPTAVSMLQDSMLKYPNHTVSIPFQQPIRQLRGMTLGNIPTILVASGADIYVIPASNPTDALPVQLDQFHPEMCSPRSSGHKHIRDLAVAGSTLALGYSDGSVSIVDVECNQQDFTTCSPCMLEKGDCESSTSSSNESNTSISSVHGRVLSEVTLSSDAALPAAVSSIAWWTDDTNATTDVLSVTRDDGILAVIDMRSRQHICAMGRVSDNSIYSHCHIPSHNLIACSSKGEIVFYDTRKLLLHCETLSKHCAFASRRSVTCDTVDNCITRMPSSDIDMSVREVDWSAALCGKYNERSIPRDIGDMQLWNDRYLVCTGEECISVWDIHAADQNNTAGRYRLAAKRMYYKDFTKDNSSSSSKVFTFATPNVDRLVMVTSDGTCEVLSLCTAVSI